MHCPFKIFQKLAPDPRVHVQRGSAPKSAQIWLFTFFLKLCMLNAPQLFIGQKSWRHHMSRCVV
jgi:hypothetical protein